MNHPLTHKPDQAAEISGFTPRKGSFQAVFSFSGKGGQTQSGLNLGFSSVGTVQTLIPLSGAPVSQTPPFQEFAVFFQEFAVFFQESIFRRLACFSFFSSFYRGREREKRAGSGVQ
jgi:hypothetical protein